MGQSPAWSEANNPNDPPPGESFFRTRPGLLLVGVLGMVCGAIIWRQFGTGSEAGRFADKLIPALFSGKWNAAPTITLEDGSIYVVPVPHGLDVRFARFSQKHGAIRTWTVTTVRYPGYTRSERRRSAILGSLLVRADCEFELVKNTVELTLVRQDHGRFELVDIRFVVDY